VQQYQNGEALAGGSAEDREQFLAALRSSIEIFVNRMRSNSQRGRSIANDSSVQTLFMTLTAMHPQLLQYIHEQEDQRGTGFACQHLWDEIWAPDLQNIVQSSIRLSQICHKIDSR